MLTGNCTSCRTSENVPQVIASSPSTKKRHCYRRTRIQVSFDLLLLTVARRLSLLLADESFKWNPASTFPRLTITLLVYYYVTSVKSRRYWNMVIGFQININVSGERKKSHNIAQQKLALSILFKSILI